jgi:bidirectional [NiFe] hydrogenase diaphorase subunit
LCALDGLTPFGGCRLCLVEIAGSPRLFPACVTKVAEGMKVTTDSPRLQRYRKMVIELLFAERNHVCSVCVSNGQCELQSMAQRLGITHIDMPYRYPRFTVDSTHEMFRQDRRRPHLGRHGPRHQRRRHHRPESAMGRQRHLHALR